MENFELLTVCQKLEDEGLVVVLKWDGERETNKKTVVVSKPGSDFSFRMESDDLKHMLRMAVEAYQGFE